jgi:hypothetical protein
MKSSSLEFLVTSLKEKSESGSRDSSLDLLNLIKKSSNTSVSTDSRSTAYHSPSNSSFDLKEGKGNIATSAASAVEKSEPRTRDLDFKLNPLDLINKFKKPSTIIFTPFTSSYTSPTTTPNFWALQGIKVNPYGKQGDYLITGTTGSALSSGGVGAVYVGPINRLSTSSGSGSGQWINFNVPFAGADGTSVYGPDILSRGNGPGGIGKVALVGTWTKSGSDKIFGFYYEGKLNKLTTNPTSSEGFKSFQATTKLIDPVTKNNLLARDTYLHSVDGGYAVGNYSTIPGFVNYAINSGFDSGSYVYDPSKNSQVNACYGNDGYTYHSLFGIWQNNNKTYTVSGGASDAGLQNIFIGYLGKNSSLMPGLPQDAVFGKGMIADIDPLTGIVSHEQVYNYNNAPGTDTLTHFEGIYYAGNGVFEAPFTAVTSSGGQVGIAYMKRLDNGSFSHDALWQTFPTSPGGVLASNDSVAGPASVGAFLPGGNVFSTYAALSQTQSYLEAAQFLH